MIYIFDTDHFTLSVLPDSPEYARIHAHALDLTREDELATTTLADTAGFDAHAQPVHLTGGKLERASMDG